MYFGIASARTAFILDMWYFVLCKKNTFHKKITHGFIFKNQECIQKNIVILEPKLSLRCGQEVLFQASWLRVQPQGDKEQFQIYEARPCHKSYKCVTLWIFYRLILHKIRTEKWTTLAEQLISFQVFVWAKKDKRRKSFPKLELYTLSMYFGIASARIAFILDMWYFVLCKKNTFHKKITHGLTFKNQKCIQKILWSWNLNYL